MQHCLEKIYAIRENIRSVVIGKDDVVDNLLISLLCSGHLLIEDIPGTGKTTLVSALADSIDCSFKRIQFTPDVVPSDITGFNMFNMTTGEKFFHEGSIMNQIILADEINRANPKTQSALLEVMQEYQVTVDGVTYEAPNPFMVLATQNPIEMAGTYSLPEAQMDRFLMRISMGYPDHDAELYMLKNHRHTRNSKKVSPVANADDVIRMQQMLEQVECSEAVLEYITSISEFTRKIDNVRLGVSPRGSIALKRAAQGHAMLHGRLFTIPDDVKAVAHNVLNHRIILEINVNTSELSLYNLITDILRTVPVPGAR